MLRCIGRSAARAISRLGVESPEASRRYGVHAASAKADGTSKASSKGGPWAAAQRRARLWVTLAALNVAKRKVDAADRAVALYEPLGDLRGLAESFRCRAEGLRNMQQIELAERATNHALELFHALGPQSGLHYAELLLTRACLLADTGRNNEARRAFETCFAVST